MLYLNCNSQRLAVIDINGMMSLYDLDKKGSGHAVKGSVGEKLDVERKVIFVVPFINFAAFIPHLSR